MMVVLLVLLALFSFGNSVQYECTGNGDANGRKLIVATCDTRSGWKEFHAMKVWNVTGKLLRDQGLHMINVCKGNNWGAYGFLTKPLLYSKYLQNYLHDSSVHAILMDSDTFWSVQTIQGIWKNYECAKDHNPTKDLVISTEMSCWVGRYCTQLDIDRWYSNTTAMTTYSPFANSGVVMGQVKAVYDMLEYVIRHNASYYTVYGKKQPKFDDQYAIADYAIKVNPSIAALDYHQLLSASCSIHAPGDPPDDGWPFLCKNRNGTLSFSCHIYNNLLKKQGHFAIDTKGSNGNTCMAKRVSRRGMTLQLELETLSATPLIWHGNGAGKRICVDLGYQSYKCYLEKFFHLTEEQHGQLYQS